MAENKGVNLDRKQGVSLVRNEGVHLAGISTLLDRIDIHVEVTPVPFSELSKERLSEKSETVRALVVMTESTPYNLISRKYELKTHNAQGKINKFF